MLTVVSMKYGQWMLYGTLILWVPRFLSSKEVSVFRCFSVKMAEDMFERINSLEQLDIEDVQIEEVQE